MKRALRSAGGALLLGILLVSIEPQALAAEERPKIGLALGGGGAKGGAHVGVLRVLEEFHVPVDYIAGTSIGAIVGGLYATGMSVDELETALTTQDWADLLRDRPARKDLSYRRKEEDARYLFDLEVGLSKKGIEFPSGLLNGQKLFFMLQSFTLPVAAIDDFDQLSIPFRAVATDVGSGEMVVLSGGNLASAIRASMALPAIFSPVELDGRLLVDGGMVNNLPVDVVREMGADIVIAVDLGAPLSSRQVESMVEVLSQTMRMLTRPNVKSRLEDADLVLTPPLKGQYKTMDFDVISEIIPLGIEAAEAELEALRRLSIDEEEYCKLRAAQRPVKAAPGSLAFVRVEGNQRVDLRIIENQLRLEAGDEPDLEVLFDDLNRVYGLGDFERVDFRVERDPGTGTNGIVVQTREKPWGPNYLHFGLRIQSDLDGETELGLLTNVTMTRLNKRGAELRTDLLLGTVRRITSEFYQPFDFDGRWFIAPSLEFESERVGFFEDGRRVADLDVDVLTAALDLGLQFTKFAEVRFGVESGVANVDIATGEIPEESRPSFVRDDVDFGGLSFEVNSDRLDSATIPRDGGVSRIRAFSSFDSLGAEDEFDRVELSAVGFKSRGRSTYLGSLDGGWSSGDLPEYALFTLGGFASLSGFSERELRGQYFGVARCGYYRNVFGKAYLGGWLEYGNVWQTSDEIDLDNAIFTATAFLGWDLQIGPLYLAWGQAEEGNSKIYVSLGRTL